MAEEVRRHRISAVLIRGPGQPEGDMAATLEHLASCCSGDNRPDCPILADLEQGELAKPRRSRGAIDRSP